MHEWAHYAEIPGELLADLLERMIDYKLGDLGEEVAQVVMKKILSP